MKPKEYFIMFLLSALWGASFLFMKISSPEMGPILTANLRVLLATITLAIICILNKSNLDFFNNWKKYLIIGTFNAALPFVLICTAELHIDASLAGILNATTPAFTAIISIIWGKDNLSLEKVFGLILGFLGVIILVGWNGITDRATLIYASFSVLAAISYSYAGVYSGVALKNLNPLNLAFGQQLSASMILLPFSIFNLPNSVPSSKAIISVVLLAVFCTALGYLLFFYLIKSVGAVKTLTVTFLVPVFSIVWGSIFLSEIITLKNILGLIIILISILLINNQIGKLILNKKSSDTVDV